VARGSGVSGEAGPAGHREPGARHAAAYLATRLTASNVDIKTVSAILGHSTSRMLLESYARIGRAEASGPRRESQRGWARFGHTGMGRAEGVRETDEKMEGPPSRAVATTRLRRATAGNLRMITGERRLVDGTGLEPATSALRTRRKRGRK
jgi:hypothetical protein